MDEKPKNLFDIFKDVEPIPRLSIELVPKKSWYNNVRSNVKRKEWDLIRRKCYRKANYVCEICGETGLQQGEKHRIECHEIWDFNDLIHKQTLVGFIALCPYCHKVKHPGLASINGEGEIVIQQLMKVNKMTRDEVKRYSKKSFQKWNERNEFEWELDISYIKKYMK